MKPIFLSDSEKTVLLILHAEQNRSVSNDILLEKTGLKQPILNAAIKTLERHVFVEGWWSTEYSVNTKILDEGIAYILDNYLNNNGFGSNRLYTTHEDLMEDLNDAISKDDKQQQSDDSTSEDKDKTSPNEKSVPFITVDGESLVTADDKAVHVKEDAENTTTSDYGGAGSGSGAGFGDDRLYTTHEELLDEVEKSILTENKDETPPNKDKNHHKQAKDEDIIIKGKVSDCFSVGSLAKQFANLIDKMNNEDGQMIGIFGAWGRGKTYFWKEMQPCLDPNKYTAVKFNAWKYQETPALWAYLYNEFQKMITPTKRSKFWYNILQDRLKVASNLVVLVIFIIFILSGVFKMSLCVEILLSIVIGLFFLLKEIREHLPSVVESLKKTIKGKDYSHHLGCQSEIENSLVNLLKHHISDKSIGLKKVILFIDDVDRCKENEMISIIDSLRTILENDDISKRLIIVCAIDDQKLKLILSNKYKSLFDNIDNKKYAREQMDKIFISGIKLSPICLDDQIKFIKKLTHDNDEQDTSLADVQRHTSEEKTEAHTAKKTETIEQINKEDQFAMFKDILTEHCGTTEITPRQLKIIYYRYLLANNILDGSLIDHNEIARSIYLRTLYQEDEKELDAKYKIVVDTVVGY